MKKVANVVFNPFINDSRVLKESISLLNSDYYVEVIAHLDKELPKEDKKRGVKIKRFSYLNRKKDKGLFGKIWAYLRFFYKSILYTKRFDYIHCNDLNALPVGVAVKFFFNKKIKVVYDAHEYETETIGLHGIKKEIIKKVEKFLIQYADAVITVSESIANEYVRMYGIRKPTLILNTPPYKEVEKKDLFREQFAISKDQKIFLYQGGLSEGRGVEILLETFKDIDSDDSVLVLMGYGSLEDKVKDYAEKYPNIYYREAVSPDVLLGYTASADYGISVIESSCLSYEYCLPNKIFEYTMAEVPFIVSNLTEMKRLLTEYCIGVVSREHTISGLKSAIKEIKSIDETVLNENLKIAKKKFNWENQEKELIKLYNEL